MTVSSTMLVLNKAVLHVMPMATIVLLAQVKMSTRKELSLVVCEAVQAKGWLGSCEMSISEWQRWL